MSKLDPSDTVRRQWLSAVSEAVALQQEGIAGRPTEVAPRVGAHHRAKELSLAISEEAHPGGITSLLSQLDALSKLSLPAQHPGYLAYVPGGGLLAAGVADLLSSAYNRYTGLAEGAPGFVRLEADTLDWLAREFGYGPRAHGLFVSGGSLANLIAAVTAREIQLGEGFDLRQATAYTSTQVHHSVQRSLRVAGIGSKQVRSVAVDAAFRMCPDRLEAAIRRDLDAGLRPFLVIASAGTTNTGAIDPLRPIARMCRELGLWLHVDGAYGGAFVLCEEGKHRLAGIEEADSITFDPHKGMFLPYGTGCLLVREREHLQRSFAAQADYLQDVSGNSGAPPSPAELGPELSRDFRGLRVWLPLMLHGASSFREALAGHLEQIEWLDTRLAQAIEEGAPIERVATPQLSTLAIRLERLEGETLDDWDARNRHYLEAVNARGRVFLSSTRLAFPEGASEEVSTIRVCSLSFRTTKREIEACAEDLIALAKLQ